MKASHACSIGMSASVMVCLACSIGSVDVVEPTGLPPQLTQNDPSNPAFELRIKRLPWTDDAHELQPLPGHLVPAELFRTEKLLRPLNQRVADLKNSQLTWNLGTLGAIPVYDADARSVAARINIKHAPILVKMLEREDQFAIAHMLLSRLFEAEWGDTLSWNGLRPNGRIDEQDVGLFSYDSTPREIQSRWRTFFASY